jgi:hypothetical protein
MFCSGIYWFFPGHVFPPTKKVIYEMIKNQACKKQGERKKPIFGLFPESDNKIYPEAIKFT